MHNAAPSLQEIIQLTRDELTSASKEDPIRECGRAALSLLPSKPDVCLKLAYQKLHDVPYKEVKACWRRLYADASLWDAVRLVEEKAGKEVDAADSWVGEVVRILDMALILTGAPQREEVIELWFMALKNILPSPFAPSDADTNTTQRPAKRQKRSSTPPLSFATSLPSPAPTLRYPIPRVTNPTLATFQAKLANPATHTPLVIEDSISHWPALHDRPWSDPAYLLSQTLNGLRLVPVEIGSSYVSPTWTQRILSMREFMETYMLAPHQPSPPATSDPNNPTAPGYLAQHDLLTQIPSLRADLAVPDYCYLDPAASPCPSPTNPPTPRLASPLLNAWFGPAGTVSPLHTDPYHNILAQVVGYKYIRLYAPAQTPVLYPRSTDENGVDMQNTSAVDLDVAMGVVPEIGYSGHAGGGQREGEEEEEEEEEGRAEFERMFPGFAQAEYVECVLGPGECLYLPPGWWHYVRSLTASFSVSFWWN
jgi:hypothetical protein